jgi:surface polysaccharide O-acyltransferase-like enzyme
LNDKRLYEIEFLHSAAFAAVVLQHILGAYSRRGDSFVGVYELSGISVVFEIVRFAVPMFVFISGLLLCYNIDSFRYPHFLAKRIRKIALPYLAWTVAYFLYNADLSGEVLSFPGSVGELAKMALTGSASYHLWYVVMIFQFILISPLLIGLIRYLRRRYQTARAFYVIVPVFIAVCLVILKLEPLVTTDTPVGRIFVTYRTRLFFSYLLFYGLGCICGLYYKDFCRLIQKTAPVFWILYLAAVGYGAFRSLDFIRQTGTLSFGCVSFLNPGFALLTAASIFAVFSLALKAGTITALRGIFSFADKYTYEAYLAHAMVLSFLSFRLMAIPVNWNLTVFYFILTVLTIPVSLLLAFCLSRIARLWTCR